MKRSLIAIAATAALALAGTSAYAGSSASVVIRHHVHGCHAWSVNGGAYKPSQSMKIVRGTIVTFTNNDVMAHKLVQTAGTKVRIRSLPSTMMAMSHDLKGAGVMAHMGASVKVTFSRAGVYRFTTKAGDDYPTMKNMKTIGEDNVLKLKVVVS